MVPSDFQLPDDFPDMSLPERAKSGPESHPWTAASSRPDWRAGDRVLAPWEPQFLYVGRIVQLADHRALIEFEDGDAGWVLFDQIRPLEVEPGQRVLCRQKMGPHFFPGEIREVRGDEVCVLFADGRGEERTRIAALRIPCQVTGPGAEPTRLGSARAPRNNLRLGDRVWAPWDSRLLYAGTVDEVQDQEVHIQFDDGKSGWVQPQQVLPLEIPIGLRVLGWRQPTSKLALANEEKGAFSPGVVTQADGKRLLVKYNDGDQEWTTLAAVAVPCEPFGPDARPTKVVPRGRPRWGWVFPVIVGVLYLLVRYGCRAG